MKALLVGHSRDITDSVPFCLRMRWHDAKLTSARSGSEAVSAMETENPDVVFADFFLSDMSSLVLIKTIREFSDVPLVVVMGSASEADRARVLEAGADEYIVSPSSLVEVLSKLTALFRRLDADVPWQNKATLSVGELYLDFMTRRVFLSGRHIKLTPHEYNLLVLLARNAGRVLSHDTLLEKAWGSKYSGDPCLLKKYIHHLRQKLGDDAADPHLIITTHGVGYSLRGLQGWPALQS